MAIENTGWQVRYDGGAQLLLEYDAANWAESEVNAAGEMSISPSGAKLSAVGNGLGDMVFEVAPANAAFDAIIRAQVGAAGVGRIDAAANQLQFSIADTVEAFVDADGLATGPNATFRLTVGSADSIMALTAPSGSAYFGLYPSSNTNSASIFMHNAEIGNSNVNRMTMEFAGTQFRFKLDTFGTGGLQDATEFVFADLVEFEIQPQFPDTGFAFENDTATSLSYSTTGGAHVAWTIGAAATSEIWASGFRAPDGTDALPSYSFINDPDTGLRWETGELHVIVDGVDVATFDATGLSVGGGGGGGGTLTLNDGSASTPSLNFSSDTDTGFYYEPAGAGDEGVKWVIGGSEVAAFQENGVEFRGTDRTIAPLRVNVPELSGAQHILFEALYNEGDPTDEMLFQLAADSSLNRDFDFIWNPSGTSWEFRFVMDGNSALVYDTDDGAAGTGMWEFSKQARFGGSVTSPGVVTSPSRTDSGIYGDTNGRTYITARASLSASFYNNVNVMYQPTQFQSGSATSPSITFQSTADAGLYQKGTGPDIVAMAVDGAEVMSWQTGAVISAAQVVVPSGSATTPGLGLGSNLNDGIYKGSNGPGGTDSIDFTINGVLAATIDEDGFQLPINAIELVGSGTRTTTSLTVNAGAFSSGTVTVTGAAVGDIVVACPDPTAWNVNLTVTAYVSAANTVTVIYQNFSASNNVVANLDCDVFVLRPVT